MGKNPIEELLQKNRLVIIDGAMATELERKGCNLNDSLWSAKILQEKPELIKEVHMDYFKAGADIAITASYQATVEGFVKRGLTEIEAKRLISSSVELAKSARDEFWSEYQDTHRCKPIVAASVGPYGAYLADGSEYRGNYGVDVAFLKEFHRDRIKLLIEAGADLLACETIPCLDEAIAIIEVLRELHDTSEFQPVYAWFSFSCKDGKHISDGTPIRECAEFLSLFDQVAAVGLNCTAPDYVDSLIKEIKSTTDKPIIIYPNSGEVYDAVTKTWKEGAVENSFAERAKGWHESGAKLIGGCCRTKPSDIAALSDWANIAQ